MSCLQCPCLRREISMPQNLMVMGLRADVAFICGPASSTTFLTQNVVVGSSASVIICVWGHPSIGWSVWGVALVTSTGSTLQVAQGTSSRQFAPAIEQWVTCPFQPWSLLWPASTSTLFSQNGGCSLQPLNLELPGPYFSMCPMRRVVKDYVPLLDVFVP